jgi:fluoride ion exporter CrcB/FEX
MCSVGQTTLRLVTGFDNERIIFCGKLTRFITDGLFGDLDTISTFYIDRHLLQIKNYVLQGCQIVLGTTYQNWKKYTLNDH